MILTITLAETKSKTETMYGVLGFWEYIKIIVTITMLRVIEKETHKLKSKPSHKISYIKDITTNVPHELHDIPVKKWKGYRVPSPNKDKLLTMFFIKI